MQQTLHLRRTKSRSRWNNFSANTKIVIVAIHSTFITPPTNSNAIKTQQQPTQ